ncbi:Hypothetical predicted protein [Paramuricea clavata]|nr:Hypothetical predicted protein [Paramuricea clavata]
MTEPWQIFASTMAASVVYNMFKYSVVLEDWPRNKETQDDEPWSAPVASNNTNTSSQSPEFDDESHPSKSETTVKPEADLIEQHLLQMKIGHRNWLAVGQALVPLCLGLRKYAEREMKKLHALITTNVGGVKCYCTCTYGKKPKPRGPAHPHGRPRTRCIWARELKNHHVFPQKEEISWHQSVGSRWDDPVHGYWEIAKLFMSDLGGNWATTTDPATTDFGSLLSLLMFCNHFKIRQSRLEAVKYWKYTWIRTRSQTFTDKEKKDAFTDIDNLMTDRQLESIKEVQDCRQSIKEIEKEEKDLKISWNQQLKEAREEIKIKETKDEIKVAEGEVKETKEEINETKEELEVGEEEIKETKEELKETKGKIEVAEGEVRETKEEINETKEVKVAEEETKGTKEEIKETKGKLEVAEGAVKETKEEINEIKEELKVAKDKIGVVRTILLSFFRNILWLLWFLTVFLMFCDRSVMVDDGFTSPTAMINLPISQFLEFNSSHLAYKREKLEMIFRKNETVAGVLVTVATGTLPEILHRISF